MTSTSRRARSLIESGDLAGAEQDLRRTLGRSPRDPAALDLLGVTLIRGGRAADAIEPLRLAAAVAPRDPAPREHLAEALRRCGTLGEAQALCEAALRLEPGRHSALNLLGLVRLDSGDPTAAAGHFVAAMRAAPKARDPILNLSVALNRLGRYAQAIEVLERFSRVEPENPLAWTNLGMALKGLRRLDEAARAFERAGDFPPARFNLGFVHMLRDDLARGLPLLEERKRILGIGAGLDTPEWDGAARPDRALLVIPEQGLGDTLLMCRFFPALAERFRAVTAVVAPPLARLIARAFPEVAVTTRAEGVPHDFWCSTMSLPFLLAIDAPEKIPTRPWIAAPGAAAEAAGEERASESERPIPPSKRLRVGINWAGNPRYAYDAIRSTHLASLETLLAAPQVEWVSLHKGTLEHEAEAFGLEQPLRSASDFLDTAAVIAGLDLVISTETAIPNLSAAMGVSTCVLTSPDPDWRWGAWYAGVTVCRQEVAGNWYGPIARALEVIQEALTPV